MNWYIDNISNSFKNKKISGLTDTGDFVTGSFLFILPDIRRKYKISIDLGDKKTAVLFAPNIRKIENLVDKIIKDEKENGKANFCGFLYPVESKKQDNTGLVKTLILTKKEPHTGKTIAIKVPSTHLFDENT